MAKSCTTHARLLSHGMLRQTIVGLKLELHGPWQRRSSRHTEGCLLFVVELHITWDLDDTTPCHIFFVPIRTHFIRSVILSFCQPMNSAPLHLRNVYSIDRTARIAAGGEC